MDFARFAARFPVARRLAGVFAWSSRCPAQGENRAPILRSFATLNSNSCKNTAMETRTKPSGFAGLRVLSLESRRATEMAKLIETYGGGAIVAPSMREVPLETNTEAQAFTRKLLSRRIRLRNFSDRRRHPRTDARRRNRLLSRRIHRRAQENPRRRPRPETRRRSERTRHHAGGHRARTQYLARTARRTRSKQRDAAVERKASRRPGIRRAKPRTPRRPRPTRRKRDASPGLRMGAPRRRDSLFATPSPR